MLQTGQTQKPQVTATEAVKQPEGPSVDAAAQQRTASDVISLGFGNNDFYTMTATKGSDFTASVAKAIFESYVNVRGQKPKISILDKEVISNLAFSAIVISMPNGNTINYFTVLLEATGRLPMKANEIMAEITTASKIPGARPNIFTTDDAIDPVLDDEIRKALAQEYGVNSMQSVDGVVVPRSVADVAMYGQRIAAIAYNAINIEAAIATGRLHDLNIAAARQNIANGSLRITHDMSRTVLQDEVGRPVRADWKIELAMVDNSAGNQSLNLQNNRQVFTRVSGYIDALPEEVSVPGPQGAPAGTITRLHPNIVITNAAVTTPTIGFMLLSVINSLVMFNKNMWMASVVPHDKNNTGALNLIANLENNQNRIGSVLDLSSKKHTPEEVYTVLGQMFSLEPVISMDIQSYGPQTFYTSIMAAAAQPGNSRAKIAAAKEIIQTAAQLTNGSFPSDFNPNEIFVNSGIVVPLGIWADRTGERDIRDIDLAFISTQTSDLQTIYRWALSNLPKEATGYDPYLTKVDIISKLIPDAEINGKAVRVTFSAKFLSTLFQSAVAAGLDPRYEPAVSFAESTSIGVMSQYLQGVNGANAGNFQRMQTASAPGVNTPYSWMGANRY